MHRMLAAGATEGHDDAYQQHDRTFQRMLEMTQTVAAAFVRELLEVAVARGARRQELLAQCGIDPAALEDRDRRIPFETYVTLMRKGQQLSGDPALALHFGEMVGLEKMTIVGMTGTLSSTSMTDDLAQLNRLAPLAVDICGGADRFRLSMVEGQLWLIDLRPDPNDFPEMTESFFARAVCAIRRMFDGARLLEAVHVTHAAPPYRSEYDRIFQMDVVFESDRNALVFSANAWQIMKTAVPAGYPSAVLNAHAEALLQKLDSSKSLRGQVEALLLPRLHAGDVSVDTIASEMRMSRQTLFRRLKTEETTFERILDELRRKLALHHLRDGKMSINETAYLVGFSDPAAFSRAFKRWTGSSPSAMR
jgi:AraC-like DNA-binding protein